MTDLHANEGPPRDCAFRVQLCFSSKQLWLSCSFLKAHVESSEEPGWQGAVQTLG
jgi:hypothetical protein